MSFNGQFLAFAKYTTNMLKCLISMKTDLRVVKTKRAIEDAFIELVHQKPFSNISVIEIADLAMVNRNTIYLHYGTKEGILEAILTRNFAENFKDFDLAYYVGSHSNKKKIYELFDKLFDVLDANKALYSIILKDNSMTGFLEQEAKKLRTTIYESFKSVQKNESGFEFLINGVFGVVTNYILYNKGNKEENVKLLSNLTIVVLKNL